MNKWKNDNNLNTFMLLRNKNTNSENDTTNLFAEHFSLIFTSSKVIGNEVFQI